MMKLTLSLFVVVAAVGCATVTLPAERLEHSESSIRSAEEVGAANVPTARLHLQLARDQTQQAKSMAEKGDERALLVLARAEADAELALSLAHETQVHGEAARALEELKAVQSRRAP